MESRTGGWRSPTVLSKEDYASLYIPPYSFPELPENKKQLYHVIQGVATNDRQVYVLLAGSQDMSVSNVASSTDLL